MNHENDTNKKTGINLVKPDWDSELASTIVELEQLRVRRLGGPVPPYIFFQLKEIFHILESLGSARIEGNQTTLAEWVDRRTEKKSETKGEKSKEIQNIEGAIDFVEDVVTEDFIFDRAFISELHKRITDGLTLPPHGEGSKTPGIYREDSIVIHGSSHTPPEPTQVMDHMDELFEFVNRPVASKDDLLVTAIAHHRLAWIHPFDNGNGRVVRLFTYALLVKQGFRVRDGRILNPTAVFCIDRQEYYDMLELADKGTRGALLEWTAYVLTGLKREIEKIDKLLNREFLTAHILIPALSYALSREHITEREHTILRAVVKGENMTLRSADLKGILGIKSDLQRSRIIKRLRDKEMLVTVPRQKRIYTIGFLNNHLLRSIIHTMMQEGFVPESLNKND